MQVVHGLFTYGKVASKLFVELIFFLHVHFVESVFILFWDGNERGYISGKHDFKIAQPEETR